MNFCLIGTGVGASMNARAIKNIKNSKIVAVCGSSMEHTRTFAKKYGIPRIYQNAEEMMKEEKSEAVIIASVPSMHYEDIVICARYVKIIVVEKPILIEVKNISKIKELINKNNLSVSAVYQHRYDYSYQKLKNIIKNIKDDLLYINMQISDYRGDRYYSGSGEWRRNYFNSGGGVLMQQGIHWLDYLFSLFNYNYLLINVNKFYQLGVETESAIAADFLLDNKIFCNIFISRMSSGKKNSINIYGKKNSYFISENSFKKFGVKETGIIPIMLYRIFNKFPFSLNLGINRRAGTHQDFLTNVINENKGCGRKSLYLDDAFNDIILINNIYKFK